MGLPLRSALDTHRHITADRSSRIAVRREFQSTQPLYFGLDSGFRFCLASPTYRAGLYAERPDGQPLWIIRHRIARHLFVVERGRMGKGEVALVDGIHPGVIKQRNCNCLAVRYRRLQVDEWFSITKDRAVSVFQIEPVCHGPAFRHPDFHFRFASNMGVGGIRLR